MIRNEKKNYKTFPFYKDNVNDDEKNELISFDKTFSFLSKLSIKLKKMFN